MAQSRETLLRKKREYAARIYAERRELIKERNRQSRKRTIDADPDEWRKRAKAYNEAYQFRHPERRAGTIKRYYEKNRDACNRRVVLCARKRKESDYNYRLAVKLQTRLALKLRAVRPPTEYTAEIIRWFEWLRARGYPDWRADGIEVDHVVPVSRFNIQAHGAEAAINCWRNLFPVSRSFNRNKRAKILPAYIRKVRALAEEYIYERQNAVA